MAPRGREAVVEEALEVDQQRTAVEDAALTPVQLSGWGHKEHSFVLAKAHLEKLKEVSTQQHPTNWLLAEAGGHA